MAENTASYAWKLRWLNARNRMLANPAFQRFAMRNPLMRRTARYHANAMFAVITGFVQTKALTATVDAGVIRRLGEGPASTAELAQGAGLAQEAMQRLLGAAKAIDLVELAAPDLWVLGQRGPQHLHSRESAGCSFLEPTLPLASRAHTHSSPPAAPWPNPGRSPSRPGWRRLH